jgi:hypothetical protein
MIDKDESKVIPYLAFKFTKNLFKRMQINLRFEHNYNRSLSIEGNKRLDEYRNILPKSITINGIIPEFGKMKLYSSILSFSDINFKNLNSERQFEELLILSNLAKSITLFMDDEGFLNYWKVKNIPRNY